MPTIFFLVLLCFMPLSGKAQTLKVPDSRSEIQLSFAPVAKQASPAVVNIYTKRKVAVRSSVSPLLNDPVFRQFFGNQFGLQGPARERVVSSLGSAVIVDAAGTMVTCNHVIDGADDIIAVLADGRELEAVLMIADPQSDLAVLSIKGVKEPLPYLTLRDPDALQVGDLVLAIGNPFGIGQTVTSGIVSALARSAGSISDYQFFIQTDAAINPGNSGGALVDMEGKLIGINSAIVTRSGGSHGIGFAIPSSMVKALLSSQTKNGKVVKPWLGAEFDNMTAAIAESLGLKAPKGVLVASVAPGSPADKAGLKPGDVLLAINEQAVNDVQSARFRTTVAGLEKVLALSIIRKGDTMTLQATPGVPPETPPRDLRKLKGPHIMNGVSVANLNPALATELGLPVDLRGVMIVESLNPKFLPGDLITALNGQTVESTKQLESVLSKGGPNWQLSFTRGNQRMNLTVIR